MLKQNELESPHSNSIIGKKSDEKGHKIAKITSQVIKRFQRHWSSVSTSKK